MRIKEQLQIIKIIGITRLSKEIGVSRQTISNWIKENKNIDDMYNIALNILQRKSKKELIEKRKEEVKELENIILKLNSTIKEKDNEILNLKKKINEKNKYSELKEKYIELLHRYTALSDYKLLKKAGKPIKRKCTK